MSERESVRESVQQSGGNLRKPKHGFKGMDTLRVTTATHREVLSCLSYLTH